MDCLRFRVRGSYGEFRKPYTTTSTLTFLCIHPIAAKGLVAGIIGIDRKDLWKETVNMKIGIRVLSPVRKDAQSKKLLNMNNSKMFNFPSNFEFLRDLEYEFIVSWDKDKLDNLEQRIKAGTSVITPYFGVSEHIAKLEFIARCDAHLAVKPNTIDTIIPTKHITGVQFSSYEIFTDYLPTQNNDKRQYTEYEQIIFAFRNGTSCAVTGEISCDILNAGGINAFLF